MYTRNFVVWLFAVALFALSNNALAFGDSLADIHTDIMQRYDIEHINNNRFNQLPSQDIVVFDVRKSSEFHVSHITNAIRVNPTIKPAEFMAQFGEKLEGKTAIFYCSVGRRSSALLSKINHLLPDSGVINAYNLEGGLFRRHNENNDLVRDSESTRQIHPYNYYWGRLIEDRKSIQYSVDKY